MGHHTQLRSGLVLLQCLHDGDALLKTLQRSCWYKA
jgi:hypothetical protein